MSFFKIRVTMTRVMEESPIPPQGDHTTGSIIEDPVPQHLLKTVTLTELTVSQLRE